MKYISLYVLIIAFSTAHIAYAQSPEKEKIEREYRIAIAAVPEKAKEFLASFNVDGKIKWFKEENENGSSEEAKFKSNGSRYSIEFTTEGALEDMEINVGFSDIPTAIEKRILDYLNQEYDHHKVEKIQEQYQEAAERLIQWRVTPQKQRTLKPKYELVVKTRQSGKKSRRYELLFDENGVFVESAKVIVRSDNILRF